MIISMFLFLPHCALDAKHGDEENLSETVRHFQK